MYIPWPQSSNILTVKRSKEWGPSVKTGQSKAVIRQARLRSHCLVLIPYTTTSTAPTPHWEMVQGTKPAETEPLTSKSCVCDSSAMGHLTPALEHQGRRGGKHGRPALCQHQPPSSCTLSPSRFCLRLEKDTVKTQGMCLLLTLISGAPFSLISQC